MPDRLFSEKEVSVLLKRAVEIQQIKDEDEAHGLSLAELKQIATETGIDPRHVEAALAEMERQPPEAEGFHLWGGPTMVDRDRVVEGTLTEAAWREMVSEVEMVYGKTGSVERTGDAFAWTHADAAGYRIEMRATTLEGRTRLRVRSRFANYAAAIHGPIDAVGVALAVMIPLIGTNAAWLAPVLSVLVLVLMFSIGRTSFGAFSKRQRRLAADALGRLERVAAAHAEAALPTATSLPEAPRVGLLDEAAPEATASAAARRRART